MRQYASSGLPQDTNEAEALMDEAVDPARVGEDSRAWVRVLESDLPGPQQAALFALFDLSRDGIRRQNPAINCFADGGRMANLIPGRVTTARTTRDWAGTNSQRLSDRTYIEALVQKALDEVDSTQDVDSASTLFHRARSLQEFQQALGDTVYVVDINFDPSRERATSLVKSCNPLVANLVLGQTGLAFSDLTNLNIFHLESIYEKAGAKKSFENWMMTTSQYLAPKESSIAISPKHPVSGATDVVQAWAENVGARRRHGVERCDGESQRDADTSLAPGVGATTHLIGDGVALVPSPQGRPKTLLGPRPSRPWTLGRRNCGRRSPCDARQGVPVSEMRRQGRTTCRDAKGGRQQQRRV